MVREVILVTIVLSFLTVECAAQAMCSSGYVSAQCQLRTNPSTVNPPRQITGNVYFRQRVSADCRRLGKLYIHVQIQGLKPNVDNTYGLHVHESADLTNGCESMGPHFNPLRTLHGGPTDSLEERTESALKMFYDIKEGKISPCLQKYGDIMRHLGDFGNVRLNRYGRVKDTKQDYLANLVGNYTIIGRGLVVHAMRDDLGLGGNVGSETTGNAGARPACCEIRQI